MDATTKENVMMKKTSEIRSWLRNRCVDITSYNVHAKIVVVDGAEAPHTEGERGGWYTRGGTPIVHPGAYSRKGWSNMDYHCSTLHVVVGRGWLKSQGICPAVISL